MECAVNVSGSIVVGLEPTDSETPFSYAQYFIVNQLIKYNAKVAGYLPPLKTEYKIEQELNGSNCKK